MRVNIYSEEMSDDVEIIERTTKYGTFTGVRMYTYLPVTTPLIDPKTGKQIGATQHQGKFMHHPDDDDSSAVTFWGAEDIRPKLRKMIEALDDHYYFKGDQDFSPESKQA